MKQKKIIFLFVFLIIVLSSNVVFAKHNSITLLALIQDGNYTRGDTADLTLEIRDGHERVFLDTFPLTKVGTQISMRFAQQYVCQEYDCSKLDFIYTILANPGIVGGPSAGAAATILTWSMLENKEIDSKTAITGTINSGGLIGQVGGVKEKLEGAAAKGFKQILIPVGTRNQIIAKNENETLTIDLVKYGEELGIKVIEISTIEEAYRIFTGQKKQKQKNKFKINLKYQEIMKTKADIMCLHTKSLENKLNKLNLQNTTNKLNQSSNSIQKVIEEIKNLTKISKELYARENYYSAASYCFRANINANIRLNKNKNLSDSEFVNTVNKTLAKINEIEREVNNKKIITMTDLQTYIIIKNRISDAKENLINAVKNQNLDLVSYAEERIFSMRGWLDFFGSLGKPFEINSATLKHSCTSKIKEAEERYNYAKTLLTFELEDVRKTINKAYSELNRNEFASCLYDASTAKSKADLILSSSGLQTNEEAKSLILYRLNAIQNTLIKAQENDVFPLIGYIYFEYAKELTRQNDIYSGLLFSGYALEMSDADMYFPNSDKKNVFIFNQDKFGKLLLAFSGGIIFGMLAIILSRIKTKS